MTEKRDKFGRRIYIFRLGSSLTVLVTMTRQVGPRQSLPRRLLRLCLRAAGDGRQGGEDSTNIVMMELETNLREV